MKTIKYFLAVVIVFLASDIYRSQNLFIELSPYYQIPVGSLSDRFEPVISYSLTFGKEQKNSKILSFRFNYSDFNKTNDDVYTLKKKYDVSGTQQLYKVKINKYEMSMKVGSGSIEWGLPVLKQNSFSLYGFVGAGIYYWDFKRNAFKDSIFVKINDTTSAFAEYINVPKLRQTEWSGGFNLGIKAYYDFLTNVGFMIGADYRVVIAELWPTLKINLENVSGFQTLEIKAGVIYRF